MECQLCAGPCVDDNGPPGFTCKMLGQPGDESWEATWVKGSTGPLTGFWIHPGPFPILFPTEGGFAALREIGLIMKALGVSTSNGRSYL